MDTQSLLAAALRDLAGAADEDALDQVRVRYLGRRGVFADLVAKIPALPPAERGAFGKEVNAIKRTFEADLEGRKAALRSGGARKKSFFDWSLPGVPLERGSLHPVTQVWMELLEVFGKLGFHLAQGPEVEVPFFNFEALNIPADHPARDASENFFLNETARTERGEEPMLLRSQTSTIQIRALRSEKPPLRVVGPGRSFRPDAVDATHLFQFHQIEGLAVDEGLSFADLKTVLLLFARDMFGASVDVRLRPSFFPFTEPSAEFDIRCWVCGGKGCPTCKRSGWVELGGCGMVDPNVFRAVGIDPERWTGFAWGFGIERVTMIRYGISDVRALVENDVRFLEQLA